jgi:endonuclease/exonuclease/phosphatase family metal-dependent hydrolase
MKHFATIIFIFLLSNINGQGKEYNIAAIGFYNVENLFDTIDSPDTEDKEFTPNSGRRWNNERYQEKLNNMATVIQMMATDKTKNGLAILGLSEVENRRVLDDLVNHPLLKKRDYKIIHHDSPSYRGIDCALIYQEKYFTVSNTSLYPLNYKHGSEIRHSRDIVLVSGLLDGEPLHIFVNHWPSRSGGEKKTDPYRKKAAKIVKSISDSIMLAEPNAKIIIMGDLNDDPSSKSVKSVLQAKKKASDVFTNELYNPTYDYYRRGIGTTAWRDSWGLFDQIIISHGLLDKSQKGYFYYKTIIYNKKFLIQKTGQYKGYPKRTFSFSKYNNGYSDHFPVFVYLLKEK